ncbi:M-phase phosphoprotein 6 [Sitodiplosis mosellana]|uniref:M-phase phosphoprotein 6 n=1 Tax=Sitodiplosis mosellana TaxID=263140 RepID=UPI0024444340|nr:M-phase phosphoprotein 6 [Sitodiplosis mosellana]
MSSERNKVKLSKSILDMKFMKRTKEKVLKEEDDAQSRAMYSNEITEKMLKSESYYIIEPSYVPCEDLNDGRFSFRGMNPDIERILELEEQAKQATIDQNVKKDVTDEDMTAYYGNVKKTIERKFQSKTHRRTVTLPEPKFKKPRLDDV